MAMYMVAIGLPRGNKPNKREQMVKSAIKMTRVRLEMTLLIVCTDDRDKFVGVRGVEGRPTGVVAGEGWCRYLREQVSVSRGRQREGKWGFNRHWTNIRRM